MVKVFASQEILDVCQHAVELHGGYGAMLEVGDREVLPRRRGLPAYGRDG